MDDDFWKDLWLVLLFVACIGLLFMKDAPPESTIPEGSCPAPTGEDYMTLYATLHWH